jgi:hypothetical protein
LRVSELVRGLLLLSRCELLLLEAIAAEAGNGSETQRKLNVCRWKPLQTTAMKAD